MVYIYILKLVENKYYIGKSFQPKQRILNHTHYNGSVWTKKYKPIKVVKIIPNCNFYDEDKYTIMYMSKYGIENVRGGSFCKIKLSDIHLQTIRHMISHSTNRCLNCKSKKHYINKCPHSILCYCFFSYFISHNIKNCYINKIKNLTL